MDSPRIPDNEAERLASLKQLRILDTPSEERFDRITRLAKKSLNTKIALISLIDADRQWFKSTQGLAASETPRDISFCGHAILEDGPFIVPDAQADRRFADNPLVVGSPEIRLYAGQPIHGPGGQRVGTLCIIDAEPRQLSGAESSLLQDLAVLVENELRIDELGASERRLRELLSEAERKASLDSLTRLWNRGSIVQLLDMEIERAARADRPVGLAMIDIDHFKAVNDTHGHVVGDHVLAAVAERIRGALRPYDSVGRFGGEEFLAVIVEPKKETIAAVGERIRSRVAQASIDYPGGALQITTSVGVCLHPAVGGPTRDQRIASADKALYAAKKNGRDRVEVCEGWVR